MDIIIQTKFKCFLALFILISCNGNTARNTLSINTTNYSVKSLIVKELENSKGSELSTSEFILINKKDRILLKFKDTIFLTRNIFEIYLITDSDIITVKPNHILNSIEPKSNLIFLLDDNNEKFVDENNNLHLFQTTSFSH